MVQGAPQRSSAILFASDSQSIVTRSTVTSDNLLKSTLKGPSTKARRHRSDIERGYDIFSALFEMIDEPSQNISNPAEVGNDSTSEGNSDQFFGGDVGASVGLGSAIGPGGALSGGTWGGTYPSGSLLQRLTHDAKSE
jgi:hypothetical protein